MPSRHSARSRTRRASRSAAALARSYACRAAYPLTADLRALLTGRIQGTLGSAEKVLGGIERAFGRLHRGQGIGERILGRDLPAPQPGQLPDRLAAFPRPVCHLTIVAGSRAPAIARRPRGLSSCRPNNGPQPRWHTNSLTGSAVEH